MGACCCACLRGGDNGASKESEMTSKRQQTAGGSKGKTMTISRKMSAPTIEITDLMKVSGNGLALAGVSIEQDAAYWEWHMKIPSGKSNDVMYGLSTSKDMAFYKGLDKADEVTTQTQGTSLMKAVAVEDGDTVGVAVQQSDLPMVQFLINGEPLHELAINRFRGNVFPAILLPEGETVNATLVLDETQFRQLSPHARFGPVIVSRGLI